MVVRELDFGLIGEADEKVEREVAVRSLDEREGGAPAMQIAIETDDVLSEFLVGDVVIRIPRHRPRLGRGEGEL